MAGNGNAATPDPLSHDPSAENASADEDEIGSRDGDEAGDYESQVLLSYRRLLPRRVDLVGDYAGNELFLIEGDSMLLRCFSDELLDFNPGFQMLHAVYNVEQFLNALALRKCNFHVAFFESNRDLCLPPSADYTDAAKYYLTRAAIIRHLQTNLEALHPDIKAHTFQAYDTPDFAEYLGSSAPYFVMAHDGAQTTQRTSKQPTQTVEESGPSPNHVALREMILSFIGRGYNVALINGLEWRDTKIMTMVLEELRRAKLSRVAIKPRARRERKQVDVSAEVQSLRSHASNLSERQQLAVMSVSKLLQDRSSTFPQDQLARFCCTFLLHEAFLANLPLSLRRLPSAPQVDGAEEFIRALSFVAEPLLRSDSWYSARSDESNCDIADFIDGRLFHQLFNYQLKCNAATKHLLDSLLTAVESLSTHKLSLGEHLSTDKATRPDQNGHGRPAHNSLAVMPFSNPVFDKHLESVHLEIDEAAAGEQTLASHKIFREVSHWHNAKKPLVQKAPPTAQSARQESWAAKRNQLFMAEMRTYAASLTNAVGKSLEPESIIVGANKSAIPNSDGISKGVPKRVGNHSTADSDGSESNSSIPRGTKSGGKKGGGGKNAAKSTSKQAMLENIAASQAKKDDAARDKIVKSWHTVCKSFEEDSDPRKRYRRAKDYLVSLQEALRDVVEAEVMLYMLSSLVQYWINACRNKEQEKRIEVTALVWNTAQRTIQCGSLTKAIVANVELTVKTLNLPSVPFVETDALPDRKLAFTFALPSKVDSLSTKLPAKPFQLLHGGPYLERSFDSAPDSRVDFQPDGWQRRVLDGIDANQSIFVVAPTSAGKTFISFYAMHKILEADDDGVLVYVAPTKALVNQIAAEIQARYSKKFKYAGRSVWAIHTRDYRINNPTGCQVLVTVPHVLQIMLLAPSNANSWSSRVRRIIFDEVHSIGQAEDGVVWEQLLLLAPCPIIALSATVGNPEEFSSWLKSTQKAIGMDLITVQHPYRYSDLRKYFYVPPQRFSFQGLPERSAFGTLGLEGLPGFNYIHPVAGLMDKTRGIPEDLALEPRDCYYLWQAMVRHQTPEYPVSDKLSPEKMLPDVARKVDVLTWEKALTTLLKQWLSDPDSPYDRLVADLGQSFRDEKREELQITQAEEAGDSGEVITEDLVKTTLPLLCRLQAQDALPAILFNYDRHQCEKLCQEVVKQLQQSELLQRKTGARWQKTLERWEEWKKIQAKAAAKKGKVVTKKGSKGDDDDEKGSKLDQQRDAGAQDVSHWDSFNPDMPMDGYHFADHTRLQTSELEQYFKQLGRRNVQQWLIDALGRGVGVHHAGMNRKYRQVVEILFRKGFLRVVIATGTLALGINMPCKTVVFNGDSVFLTALNYRQGAGRAGRRGFDLLGNVVFQGVSRTKVCRLLSSRLPDLNGHFPITTTLVLRLFTLLHESKNAKYAVNAINALLSQPRLYMGGPSFKDQTMHHLRFSIEYLRRQHLLDARGATLNFTGLVSHLYFTENASFAFHALLKEGYFHDLCSNINSNRKDTVETLMLVMAHLFNRIYCRQVDREYREKVVKPSSSLVFLPPLPKMAAEILRTHNQQTLQMYKTYVETFVDEHLDQDDRTLPLTGIVTGNDSAEGLQDLHGLPPTRVRSAFVALSGAGDDFDTIHELCQTIRHGVFLEEAVVPHVDIYPDETDVPLNAWLLDFFKHGDVFTIERANGVRRADIWFLLNDFSLVLATIIASLLNFMKLHEGTDMDMLDVMGNLDSHEEAEDNLVAEDSEQQSEASGPSIADSAIAMPERLQQATTRRKAKNADSWEDVADEENAVIASQERRANTAARLEAEEEAERGDGNNEGLKNVLKAMQTLHAEFTVKFKAMWA